MTFPTNPFTPQKIDPHAVLINEPDIVHYMRQEQIVSVDENDPGKFVTKEVIVESERFNRKEYIASFSDDVGIQNILKKVAMTGDPSHLCQIQRASMPIDQEDPNKREIVQDFTPLADGETGAAILGDNARKLFAALPSDLVAGRSYEEFIKTVTQTEIDAFVASKTNKGGQE